MTKAYSAPGKAMLVGGYLVLDPQYNSYVTALSSRMHAIVLDTELESRNRIVIRSPQFDQGQWEYVIENDDFSKVKEVNGRRNPFLEATVLIVLSYVQATRFNVCIDIFSDAGFHSQEDTTVRRSANGKKQFLYHSKAIQDVAKTGLGSSACLVTIVTTSLLSYFGVDVDSSKDIIHNTAQIAHCLAQKKVGSGFDVAAAVYGSIIYRRFDQAVVNEVLNHVNFAQPTPQNRKEFEQVLKETIESKWEFNNQVCTLPPKIKLLMGDIQGGSETPKLVGKILSWKKEKPEQSDKLYYDLNNANEQFMRALTQLQESYEKDEANYLEGIAYFASHSTSTNTKHKAFNDLIDSIAQVRENLRKLTAYSGASVEPQEQSRLLDECTRIPGCFGGVVPGAGGYDAIALLVVEDSIKQITQHNDEELASVCWLDLHEEKLGLKSEDVKDYLLE